jgi:hypothetical protein
MRRKRLRRFIPLLLAALAVGAWLLIPTRPPVDAEAAARVQVGMTLAEVETALGGRPDAIKAPAVVPRTAVWLGPDGACLVNFGADGRVQTVEFNHKPNSAIDRAHVRAAQRLRSLQQTIGWR